MSHSPRGHSSPVPTSLCLQGEPTNGGVNPATNYLHVKQRYYVKLPIYTPDWKQWLKLQSAMKSKAPPPSNTLSLPPVSQSPSAAPRPSVPVMPLVPHPGTAVSAQSSPADDSTPSPVHARGKQYHSSYTTERSYIHCTHNYR